MQAREKYFDAEKLSDTVDYCRDILKPFLKNKKFSSLLYQTIASMAKRLDNLLMEKQKKPGSLDPKDLQDIQEALNDISMMLIPLKSGKTIRKFERSLREIVLSVENHATYNHIAKPILKPKNRFHVYDSDHKKGVHGKNNNQIIQEMIEKADKFAIVYISTESYNRWGHVALKIGDQGYVHVNTLNGKPKFYTPVEWQFYLQNGGYGIMGIQNVDVPNVENAKEKLLEFANAKWRWNPRDNICAHFAQQILEAGGADCSNLKISFLPIHQLANVPVSALVPSQEKSVSFDKETHPYKVELPDKKKFFSFKKDHSQKDAANNNNFLFGRIGNFFQKKIAALKHKPEVDLPEMTKKNSK